MYIYIYMYIFNLMYMYIFWEQPFININLVEKNQADLHVYLYANIQLGWVTLNYNTYTSYTIGYIPLRYIPLQTLGLETQVPKCDHSACGGQEQAMYIYRMLDCELLHFADMYSK